MHLPKVRLETRTSPGSTSQSDGRGFPTHFSSVVFRRKLAYGLHALPRECRTLDRQLLEI